MRSRHQNGHIELTAARTWKAHWHEYIADPETGKQKRVHKSKIVGTKSEMTKWKATEELEKIVAPLNTGGNSKQDDRVTLEWFWTNRFLPMRAGSWRVATKRGCETDWKQYLNPKFGGMALKEIDLFSCQSHINQLAADGYSESVVKRARTMLSSVLELAVELDFTVKNAAKKVKLPVCIATAKPTLSKEELVALIKAVTIPRDQLILMVGAFCALTASELFGLRWGCYDGDKLIIRAGAYQGQVYDRVKRKARERMVPLAPVIAERFEAWKKLSKNTGDEALIFPGRGGKAMWSGIFLEDHIKPFAATLGITTPVTFQVLRRSCATRNQANGTLKDVQTHLGHSNIQTTGNTYMQAIPASVKEMVDSDVADVMATKPVNPEPKPQTQRIQ
jgi:integrase